MPANPEPPAEQYQTATINMHLPPLALSAILDDLVNDLAEGRVAGAHSQLHGHVPGGVYAQAQPHHNLPRTGQCHRCSTSLHTSVARTTNVVPRRGRGGGVCRREPCSAMLGMVSSSARFHEEEGKMTSFTGHVSVGTVNSRVRKEGGGVGTWASPRRSPARSRV